MIYRQIGYIMCQSRALHKLAEETYNYHGKGAYCIRIPSVDGLLNNPFGYALMYKRLEEIATMNFDDGIKACSTYDPQTEFVLIFCLQLENRSITRVLTIHCDDEDNLDMRG